MRMQGGKTGDVCDAAMPQTRRVCGRFWFSPPPAGGGGGVVPRVCGPECGRNRGGVLWEAWKARPRALRVRWAWCGRWMGARTPFPTGNAGVAAAGVESVGSAHACQYGGWSSATRRGARAPFPPLQSLEGKGGLGEWVPDARGVTAPSGGGPPAPTRVVRVVQGAMAHHRAQPPKLLVRDAPLPSGRRLPRLLQLPVLHLLVPAQHPPRQEVGSLLH